MKTTLFILLFCASLAVRAQTAETLGELTPVPSDVGKFRIISPKNDNFLGMDYEVKFAVKIENVNLPDNRKAVAVTIEVRAADLVFQPVDGLPTASVNFFGRITSKDKKTDGFYEEVKIARSSTEELNESSRTNFVISRKVFALPPGRYQIGVAVRDLTIGMRGMKIIKFRIPSIRIPILS